MQASKSNFIEEMRKKLNAYHIEKHRKLQENFKNKEIYKQQNQARDALIAFDETFDDAEPSGFQQISGWSSNRASTLDDNQVNSERRSYTFRKNTICSFPSKALGFQFQKRERNPDMINYLKAILGRLQSPVAKNRSSKTQGIRKSDQNTKLKTQQTVQQLRKTKLALLTNKNIQKVSQIKDLKCEKSKFQTIDLNTQNNPFTTHTVRAVSQYQKIKRKNQSQNQYQIDIAHEKDILQQLIRGSSANKTTYNSQKGQRSTQKFTLKNLLC